MSCPRLSTCFVDVRIGSELRTYAVARLRDAYFLTAVVRVETGQIVPGGLDALDAQAAEEAERLLELEQRRQLDRGADGGAPCAPGATNATPPPFRRGGRT
ncbi:hypothetical protein BE08_36935 [Sorangium cellulosum]|uniref:Uncharacterized protein n=1 Tax=Sorangium cellulosum TaxID=56 RepID=A0A150PRQ0_SORCE|nr:hypothetical protein BE08_36935 [Sorangium cellulosum]